MATIELDKVTKRFHNDTQTRWSRWCTWFRDNKSYGRSRGGDRPYAVQGVDLQIGEGEFVVLLGPSGSGKTTTLNMIAGLEDITSGNLRIQGERANERAPKDRNLAMVFQAYALYPHMTVWENIAFPLSLTRAGKDTIDDRVAETAHRLGLDNLLDRTPGKLSGGQRQRVAMGRAIVRPNPNAFLMDEPLSNLDPKLRDEMQTLVADLQKELRVTTIYVTHDQTEAMKLGDRLVVMREGKVEQNGAPQELYEHPKNLFVAAFIGSPAMNFQPARLEDSVLRCALGKLPLSDRVRRTLEAAGAPREVIVGIRPEHFEDAALAQPWAGRHGATFTSRVARLESTGADKYAHFKLDDEPIGAAKRKELVAETDTADVAGVTSLIARLSRASAATQGEMVKICFDPDLVQIFHPSDGRNLTLPPEMPCGTQLHRLGARAPG